MTEVAMHVLMILLFALGTALPAAAACTGPGIMAQLTDAERAQIATVVADTPYANGLSYTAVRGGQQITLVGTLHIFDPGLAAIRARIGPAIVLADIMLAEASPEDAAKLQEYIAETPDLMFLTDGPTLPELLDDDTWDRLREAANARQIPSFLAAKMQPWFLSISMAMPPCATADLAAGRLGLDFMLMDDAETAGVPVQSLESWRMVIDIMRSGTMEQQLEALKMGLMPVEAQNALFVTMLDLYLQERTTEVWEAGRLSLKFVPGLSEEDGQTMFDETEQMLLVDRNLNWMPVIAEAMETNNRAVIAVGAAHLPGEYGLLRLLEQDGWTIAPLR